MLFEKRKKEKHNYISFPMYILFNLVGHISKLGIIEKQNKNILAETLQVTNLRLWAVLIQVHMHEVGHVLAF